MEILLACAIVAIAYLFWRNGKLSARVAELSAQVEQSPQTPPKSANRSLDVLGYEWYDTEWPYEMSEDEEQGIKYENPAPFSMRDLYTNGLLVAEYKSANSAIDKKTVLRRIRRSGITVPLEVSDLAFNDDSPVRAWAAAHLDLVHHDYTNRTTLEEIRQAPVIRDFEALAQTDPDPFVRASFYSNPEFSKLPWRYFQVVDHWRDSVASMSQLERLALMRNPDLCDKFLVALMQEDSGGLNMTKDQHCRMICAGAVNPNIVASSRRSGRDFWLGFDGDPFPPIETYGEMWSVATDRWRSEILVPFFIFKYVQTTENDKLKAYNKLLVNSDKEAVELRQEILRSCDPLKDATVLRPGLNDPHEECRKIAEERAGKLKSWILKERNK